MIAGAAKAMIAFAVVVGTLAGLALMGVASLGPALDEWAAGQSRSTWLLLAFVVWPALGALYVGLEALFEGAWDLRRRSSSPSAGDHAEGRKQWKGAPSNNRLKLTGGEGCARWHGGGAQRLESPPAAQARVRRTSRMLRKPA